MQSEHGQERRRRLIVSVCVLALIPVAIVLGLLGGSGGTLDVRINELLSSNSAFPDPAGQFRDFVELVNTGSGPADLGGCGLTDGGSVKYRFPAGTVLGPGEYLVVWCDSAAEDAEAAPFSISKDGGETVALLSARGHVLDSVETIPAARNCSMVPEGEGWGLSNTPTPGFENSPEGYAAYLAARHEAAPSLVISEFMSSNSLYPGPDGQFGDWIEVCNSGANAIDLGGWSLSDSAGEAKYFFPYGESVPAGGYRVLWCLSDGLGFSLARAGGESLNLLAPNGALADRVETPALDKNIAYARAASGWERTERASPGFENTAEGFEAYLASMGWGECPVRFSEAMADNRGCILSGAGTFGDWIELRNSGTEDAILDGYWLSNDPEEPLKWQFPALTVPAGGFSLVWCDGLGTLSGGECHAAFSLSKYGESLTLSTPVGSPVDAFAFGQLGPDRAALASAGGAEEADSPSPGFANTPEGVLAFQASRPAPEALAINEVMSANGHLLRQNNGSYYDWVELRNNGDTALNLAGCALSDGPEKPRFVLPNRVLAPGELCIVLLAGGEAPPTSLPCAPFALNAAEDWIYLFSPEGAILDYARVTGLPVRGSMGRVEGENGFFYFASPTPGEPNGTGTRRLTEPPVPDTAPGIYNGIETLTVALSGEGEIHYTLDGSVPTERSPLYEGPLELSKTTPLRARCFSPGTLPGGTATLNYIINENHTLPVVCFDLAPNDFNYIYDGSPRGDEVSANISLYELEGGGFSQDCGLTLHGASSRHLFVKRSMKALFRPRYAGNLEYDVFGDGELTTFDSITLRGGTMENSYGLVRDAICTQSAYELGANVLALKLRYCVLYVNGRYWGIYVIREAYSEKYVADHLGCTEEDVRISRAPAAYTPNRDLSDAIFDLERGGVRTPERYEAAGEWLDLDSLVDWMIIEAYFTNTDIPGNVRYIHNDADGKWHYALFDLDNALMSPDPSWQFVFDYGNESGIIPRSMSQSPQFREKLCRRLAEWLSGALNEPRVRANMDALYELIEPEWPREAARWGGEGLFASSHRALTNCLADGRGKKLVEHLGEELHMSRAELEEYFGDILE